MTQLELAPKKIFVEMLKWMVIPTFDLVIEYGKEEIIIVKRKIAPYKDRWALPGLRILKGESIEECFVRIAGSELGLKVNPKNKVFLGQYMGKFKTENNRQDLSTGFAVKSLASKINLNKSHFYSVKLIKSVQELPSDMGEMYKFYIKKYFELKKRK